MLMRRQSDSMRPLWMLSSESGVAEAEIDAVDKSISIDLAPNELILLLIRPHWTMLLVNIAPPAVALALVTVAWQGWVIAAPTPAMRAALAILAILAIAVGALAIIEQRIRLYVLTDRRVVRRSGSLRVRIQETPLKTVREVTAQPSREDATVGLVIYRLDAGSICWEHCPEPARALRIAQQAIDRYGGPH